MHEWFVYIENTALATWVRESPSQFAYTGMLFLHAVGLALAVGISFVITLRVLGIMTPIPASSITHLFRPLWIGFWINAFSGTAMLASDLSREMANAVFEIKLVFVVLAAFTMWLVQRALGPAPAELKPARLLSAAALVFWIVAVTFGRFVAYPGLLGLG